MKPTEMITKLLMLLACAGLAAGAANVLAKGDPDADPPLAPLPEVPQPPDNRITNAKAELGKLLFFDPKLTGDASLSCGDCHDPKQGWGFADPISRGYPGTVHWRNSQTVVNSGFLGKLFWQGSSNSLERQAPTANKGAVAGNGENDVMEARLRQTPEYIKRFKEVFGTRQPNLGHAWMAIATFERAMLTQKNSPLDRYLKGDKSALSEQAVQGMELFTGKANCIECHNGPMLTDEKYYNVGLSRPIEFEESGMNQITFRWENYAKGVHEKKYREWKDDAGLYYTTKRPQDAGKFRTPPLRYVAFTAPYMHAGQFFTLEEVIDFYNEGGGDNEFTERYANKTPILKPLDLSDEEKEALVAFLEELSGVEIVMPIPKVPEYGVMPDVPGLSQAQAKRIGLETYLSTIGRQ
jgi:cytochrome c peroxidase